LTEKILQVLPTDVKRKLKIDVLCQNTPIIVEKANQKFLKGDGTNIGDIDLSTCSSTGGGSGATSTGTSVSLLPGKARFGFAILRFGTEISFKISVSI
jgi:hypothetical protein